MTLVIMRVQGKKKKIQIVIGFKNKQFLKFENNYV